MSVCVCVCVFVCVFVFVCVMGCPAMQSCFSPLLYRSLVPLSFRRIRLHGRIPALHPFRSQARQQNGCRYNNLFYPVFSALCHGSDTLFLLLAKLNLCTTDGGGGGEGERDRDRQTETDRPTQTDRPTGTDRQRLIRKATERHAEKGGE